MNEVNDGPDFDEPEPDDDEPEPEHDPSVTDEQIKESIATRDRIAVLEYAERQLREILAQAGLPHDRSALERRWPRNEGQASRFNIPFGGDLRTKDPLEIAGEIYRRLSEACWADEIVDAMKRYGGALLLMGELKAILTARPPVQERSTLFPLVARAWYAWIADPANEKYRVKGPRANDLIAKIGDYGVTLKDGILHWKNHEGVEETMTVGTFSATLSRSWKADLLKTI